MECNLVNNTQDKNYDKIGMLPRPDKYGHTQYEVACVSISKTVSNQSCSLEYVNVH